MKTINKIKQRKLVVVLAVMALSLIIITPALAITWGQTDTDHTNVGAIVLDIPGYGLYQLGSGTLISSGVFLTAGHCTYFLNYLPPSIKVYINFDQNALNAGTLLEVDQAITHPYYNQARSNPYDVGVLILEEPVTGITPATLPDEGFLDELKKEGKLRKRPNDEAAFTVVGYGGTLHWPPTPPDPKVTYDNLRQNATSEYQALLKSWLRLSQNQATGDGGTCYGDSGGPAFWTDPVTGDEILVGITSWGDNQCVATGFNYRVDTSDTLGFIRAVFDAL